MLLTFYSDVSRSQKSLVTYKRLIANHAEQHQRVSLSTVRSISFESRDMLTSVQVPYPSLSVQQPVTSSDYPLPDCISAISTFSTALSTPDVAQADSVIMSSSTIGGFCSTAFAGIPVRLLLCLFAPSNHLSDTYASLVTSCRQPIRVIFISGLQ